MKLPTFMILGAAKAGTTALYYYLNQHPDIYMSYPKEPLFFEKEFEKGTDYYLKTYFSGYKGQKVVGEARHRNLYLGYVPKRIEKVLEQPKFIVVCRNPVERAISHYCYNLAYKVENLSFDDAIKDNLKRLETGPYFLDETEAHYYIDALDENGGMSKYRSYIDTGYYAEQIVRYIDLFGKDRVKIIFSEDLNNKTKEVVNDLLEFLNLDALDCLDIAKQNQQAAAFIPRLFYLVGSIPGIKSIPGEWRYAVKSAIIKQFKRKSQDISLDARKKLVQHFKPYNIELENLTNRNLEHWDKLD